MGRLRALHRRYRAGLDDPFQRLRYGSRTITWAPRRGLGFGNFLYLWLHAHTRQALGHDHRVITVPGMDPWLDQLPELRRELALLPDEVHFADRREWGEFSRFGDDFTRQQLHDFVGGVLLPAPLLQGPPTLEECVVVNVRRGDYYSVPAFRGKYSFDIAAYLDIALSDMRELVGPIPSVLVVSDDIDWCRTKIDGLVRGHCRELRYISPRSGPQEHFRAVATARWLIGTNSTFSYWGGYVSGLVHKRQSQVVMPRFHARMGDTCDAYQLDPSWHVVESIPGGWDG